MNLTKWLLLKFFIIGLFSTSIWADIGGELGNGYVPYENLLGEFQVEHPQDWSIIENQKAVSIFENSLSGLSTNITTNTASISILDRDTSEIKSEEDLLNQVQFYHPEKEWLSIEISGAKGFQSKGENQGVIYLFRSEGRVLSIRFDSSNNETSLHKIKSILNSLRI